MINKDPIKEFYQHRWALNYGDTAKKETPEFWDERAGDFAAKAHSANAKADSEAFLDRFKWDANETVLDVGAGPGTFAVPLAKRVKKVTATDFSRAMLDELKNAAKEQNVNNIDILAGRWLELNHIEPHDTVIALNSLGVISTDANHVSHLEMTLKKLAECCKKRLLVLLPHADSPLPPELRAKLSLDEISIERRRIAVLYYAMIDCGMLPSLLIIKRPFRWTFKDIDEAVETLLIKAGVKETGKFSKIMEEFLQNRIKKDETGRLFLAYEISQALYVWEK
ncbi:MAG: class I SAM-dependent methyltransferase [Candidatus Rifleibacteriota bacterium]